MARQRTFFHRHPAAEDPGELLEPAGQVSEPWGEPEHGPCDKCGGGTALYECFSCIERARTRSARSARAGFASALALYSFSSAAWCSIRALAHVVPAAGAEWRAGRTQG